MTGRWLVIVLLLLVVAGSIYFFVSHKSVTQNSSTPQQSGATIKPIKKGSMKIISTAFSDHQPIPQQFTCDGNGVNPKVTFENIPAGAKSLVLLMDDPDVPKNLKPDGVFDHWIVYNMDPSVREIPENSKPPGTEGLNSTGKPGYTPPCPPDREHRYFFKLYALDSNLQFDDPSKVTKAMVLEKMQGHVIEEAELVGVYNRPQNQ